MLRTNGCLNLCLRHCAGPSAFLINWHGLAIANQCHAICFRVFGLVNQRADRDKPPTVRLDNQRAVPRINGP